MVLRKVKAFWRPVGYRFAASRTRPRPATLDDATLVALKSHRNEPGWRFQRILISNRRDQHEKMYGAAPDREAEGVGDWKCPARAKRCHR